MVTKQIRADRLITEHSIVEMIGGRRQALKICEYRQDGDNIELRVRMPDETIQTRKLNASDPVRIRK